MARDAISCLGSDAGLVCLVCGSGLWFWKTIINSISKEENSGIPQCLASNYIINSMLIRDLAFVMGLLGMNADLPSPSPLLYVNCLDLDSQSYVNLSNLACCRFLTVMGYVSFPKDLQEWFLCLFVRSETLNGRLPLDFFHAFTVCLDIDLKGSIYVTTWCPYTNRTEQNRA